MNNRHRRSTAGCVWAAVTFRIVKSDFAKARVPSPLNPLLPVSSRKAAAVQFRPRKPSIIGSTFMVPSPLIQGLRRLLGPRHVLVEPEDVVVYEQDGSFMQVMPEIV